MNKYYSITCKTPKCGTCIACKYTKQKIIENKPFIVRIETINTDINHFLIFKDYEEYAKDTVNINKDTMAIHEVIFAFASQRLKIDIDFKPFAKTIDCSKYFTMMEMLIDYLEQTFNTIYGHLILDPIKWCICVSRGFVNDNEYKIGYHITSKNYLSPDLEDVKNFSDKLKSILTENNRHELIDVIDWNTNKLVQNWRILGSGKKSGDTIIRKKRIQRDTDKYDDSYAIITYKGESEILPKIVKKHNIAPASYDDSNMTVTSNDKVNLIALAKSKMTPEELQAFTAPVFNSSKGRVYINYTRIHSSYCEICEREHEKDNTLYFFATSANNVIKRCLRYVKPE